MLSNDIGDLGELTFQQLCAKNLITCHPPSKDRKGWDLFLELSAASTESYDARPGIYEAKVQIKSTNSDKPKIQFKLSTLETFIKTPLPCFIGLLVFNNNSDITRLYLKHVDKALIKKIFKRLRECEIGGKELSKSTTTITFKADDIIDTTNSQAIKEHVINIIKDTATYAVEKGTYLKTITKNETKYIVNFSIPNEDKTDLIKFTKGEINKLPVDHFKITESRFGIDRSLPLPAEKGFVEIGNFAGSEATLRYKYKEYQPFKTIKGKISAKPLIDKSLKEHWHFEFNSNITKAIIFPYQNRADTQMPIFGESKALFSDFQKSVDLWEHLLDQSIDFELVIDGETRYTYKSCIDKIPEEIREHCSFLSKANKVYEFTQIPLDQVISIDDIFNNQKAISDLYNIYIQNQDAVIIRLPEEGIEEKVCDGHTKNCFIGSPIYIDDLTYIVYVKGESELRIHESQKYLVVNNMVHFETFFHDNYKTLKESILSYESTLKKQYPNNFTLIYSNWVISNN